MENSTSPSFQTSNPSDSIYSTSDNSSGFFDSLKNINVTTWIIIILILAFLGFNIFIYLAKGTQDITNFFSPLLEKIFGKTADISSQVVNVSAEGAKAVVSGTATAVNAGLNSVQNVVAPTRNQTQTIVPPHDELHHEDDEFNSLINNSQQDNVNDYHANEANSSINSFGKSGWCYIGEDRGYRSCTKVGVNDKCMSGDIFPSQELCVNPNLRA